MEVLILDCLAEVLLRLVSGDSGQIKPVVDAVLMFALNWYLTYNISTLAERVFLEVCASSDFSSAQVKEKFHVQQILQPDAYL